jgi:hypothetical protein
MAQPRNTWRSREEKRDSNQRTCQVSCRLEAIGISRSEGIGLEQLNVGVLLQRQSDVSQIRHTMSTAGGFAYGIDGRQEKRNQTPIKTITINNSTSVNSACAF